MQHETEPLYPSTTMPLKDNYGQSSLQMLQPASAQQAVITSPPTLQVGPQNTVTVCSFCHASIKTAVRHTVTTRTHLIALLCTFMCCCCCIPYCMESTKNSDHYCPACQRYLGTYQK